MADEPLIEGVAVIGMSGRFPGARDLDEYWRLLREGVEAISSFTEAELLEAGTDPEILRAPGFVRAGGVIEDADLFDAAFFGFNPREAEIMDPQIRLFLEHASTALESAGYDSERYPGSIAIFGGMTLGGYLTRNIAGNPEAARAAGDLQIRIYNDKDFLASLTAYKLNLRGPSATIQTACSTSLVATAMACQSLLSYQCDIAMAGGVCIPVPLKSGYFSHDSVFSPDGHCRAFDASADGTVAGAGVGMLVFKRLEDALADGDRVLAVVRGWAVNNDGSQKVGYTAPSIDGQAEVIAMAQAMAGVEPDTVSYIETHGTGTPLGDEIEVAALSKVFRETTDRRGFCAIGSVKTNIGHLDAAAGAASLIKTVLALNHRELPPSLHYERPNPRIDFAASPFYVNAGLAPWKSEDGEPRRAGVSAFAVGGVNAHVILEEAPELPPTDAGRPWQLLTLSARTPAALDAMTDRLAEHLRRASKANLADMAFTLQVGRRVMEHRRTLVCRDTQDALEVLSSRDPKRMGTAVSEAKARSVAFLLPGLGNHYVGMARELYDQEAVFRQEIDRCAELLRPELGLDFRTLLYPETAAPVEPATPANTGPDLRRMVGRSSGDGADEGAGELIQTQIAQPVLFAVEYALARLWMSWGVKPKAMLGFSIGEYVAACLAGVFTLEGALALVARRAKLIQDLRPGAMLAVPLSERDAEAHLGQELSICSINGPEVCVVGGPEAAVAELEARLSAKGLSCRRLQTTHAFHSRMMEPIAAAFTQLVAGIERRAPTIPFLSNVTGTWITPAEATDPAYWARHLRQPVRFADGLQELWRERSRVLLEVGPGQTLSSWALQLPGLPGTGTADRVAVPSMRHTYDPQSDQAFLLNAVARLWLAGAPVDWKGFHAGGRRRRIELPSYPFERRRYWIEPNRSTAMFTKAETTPMGHRLPLSEWFHVPVWRQSARLATSVAGPLTDAGPWLLLTDSELGLELAERLEALGARVALAAVGNHFERVGEGTYVVDPQQPADTVRLFEELAREGLTPRRVVHLWSCGAPVPADPGFHGLVHLAQALGDRRPQEPVDLAVVTSGLLSVTGAEELVPERATLLGPSTAMAVELPGVSSRGIDLALPAGRGRRGTIERLLVELTSGAAEPLVALRGGGRWLRDFEPVTLEVASPGGGLLRDQGVYLVTGGLGGLGLVIAEELARSRARLVLVGRTPFPPREDWPERSVAKDETARTIRRLQEMEAKGAEILVVNADVSQLDDVRRVRSLALDRFGRVDGVVHAAGVMPGGMLQAMTRERADSVLAPKVAGTKAIAEVFAGDGLDFLMLFSSLTSLFGAFGLADHTAANGFLDALAYAEPMGEGTRVVSIDWDAWLEVGQAAAAAVRYGVESEGGPGEPVRHPLLGERRTAAGQTVYRARLATDTHWVVAEHRVAGLGLLPGTAYLEMARAAFSDLQGDGPAELSSVAFLAPLVVRDGETRDVETILTGGASDTYSFTVRSRGGLGQPWHDHAQGRVGRGSGSLPPQRSLERILAVEERAIASDAAPEAGGPAGNRESGMTFGPRWSGLLSGVRVGSGEALARLNLPGAFASDLDDYAVHPALLDAATGLSQLLGEGTYLPLGYEGIVFHRALPGRIQVYARFDEAASGADLGTLSCDIAVLDEAGEEVATIRGYTLRRITDSTAVAVPSNETTEPAAAGAGLLGGIRPSEGAEVFRRLLSASFLPPQILVSTRPMAFVIEQARAVPGSESEAPQLRTEIHGRPDLPTPFEAPRSELEERLANLWRNILGLDRVGVHDNFFDLGGDSLMATRLIGRLDEDFGVQLSLRTIFEAPTVADLAVRVVQANATQVESEDLAAILAEIQGLSADDLLKAAADGGTS